MTVPKLPPVPLPWRPLTEDEIWASDAIMGENGRRAGLLLLDLVALVRAVEEEIQVRFAPPDQSARIAALEREVEALRKFTGLVLGEHRMNIADVDGFDVENWAVECGLLEKVEMLEPCGEDCQCVEYHGIDSFPVECLRNSPIGQAAVDAAIEWGKT